MMQVMCNQDIKRICDGTCSDPCCMQKHPPTTYALQAADELRAKFEAWWEENYFYVHEKLASLKEYAWMGWQAAHASRNAEVEALKRDAERWRAARSCIGNVGVYEGTPTHEPGVGLLLDEAADKAIDAAMAKESGE